jgi:DNA-binding transcriptional LysR family regulator
MDDMRNLVAFVRVARSGSFTAAAAGLGLTTAAVSKIVSRLERQLATRLFTRSTRRLALTTEGLLFLEKVEAALAQLEEAQALLLEKRKEPAGTLRLWTSVAIGKDHVLPMLAEFLELWPKVSVDIRCDDHVPNLIASGYDVAVHHATLGKGTSVIKRLADLPLVLVASPGYLAKHGVPGSPEDLAHHECIGTHSSAVPAARWEFRRVNGRSSGRSASAVVLPRGRVTIADQYEAVLDAALCGLGATLVFAHSAIRYLESNQLKVLLPDWKPLAGAALETNKVQLWYPNRTYVPYNVRVLVDFLTARFRSQQRLAFDPHRWAAR